MDLREERPAKDLCPECGEEAQHRCRRGDDAMRRDLDHTYRRLDRLERKRRAIVGLLLALDRLKMEG
jgi:hypothetical protein